MGKFVDLTGKKFGKLVAMELTRRGGNNRIHYKCLCDCGIFVTVSRSHLSSGHTRSCGCIRRDTPNSRTHGMSQTLEYGVWKAMKARCYNKKVVHYERYGGRGISVCEEWCHSFETFYKDMGKRPSKFHSIDRIDNDGEYCKDNCKWSTKVEQSNNTKNNRLIEYKGASKTLAHWARDVGINLQTLSSRLNLYKWDIKRSLTEPVRGSKC